MIYTFHLRSVTEIFAGGADIQSAELRPSAFRGPLRFWFRAMMGKVVGNDLERLRRLEAAAFGATDSGSPFVLRLAASPQTTDPNTIITPSVGKAYLGFSLYDRVDDQMRLARGCIPAGENFTLSLHFRRPDQKLQDVLLGSLWLLLNFGGIGSRTRRGFGCIAVRSVELNQEACFNYFSPTKSGPNIQQFYKLGQQLAEKQFRGFAGDIPGTEVEQIAEYTNFSSWKARLIVRAQSPVGAQAADHWFSLWGVILRSFRNGTSVAPGQQNAFEKLSCTTSDYRKVMSYLMDGDNPERLFLENDVLGLPIVVQSGTRNNLTKTLSWRGPSKEKEGQRASPLVLHPVPLPDGRLGTLIVFFVSRFLPEGAEITIQYPSSQPLETATDADICKTADQFFEYLKDIFSPREGNPGDDLLASLPEVTLTTGTGK